jgi:uncharacterized protein with PIN domain
MIVDTSALLAMVFKEPGHNKKDSQPSRPLGGQVQATPTDPESAASTHRAPP